jgi:probable ATP-dependent RNA helicase DDX4
MLDMGFGPQIRQIIDNSEMPPKGERITLMFSATFPEQIQNLAAEFLHRYLFLTVGRVGGTCSDVKQVIMEVAGSEKRNTLETLLKDSGTDRTLVFVERKKDADFLASFLSQRNYPATSLNADRSQQEREQALLDFRKGTAPVLVATAVAARGLDINDVKHVINYDLPSDHTEYVHRVGRTGRIGNKGLATSFFDAGRDSKLARGLVKLLSDGEQDVPDWLEETALRAVGTGYGADGGQFRDTRPKFGGSGGGAPGAPKAQVVDDDDEEW